MSKSLIGFFDILGFKELVERNSHKKLLKIYEEALYFNLNQIAKIGIDLHKDEEAKESLKMIKQLIISDSIIFIQKDFSHKGLFFLILQSKVLLSISMREGIPLRGAISLGEISIIERMGTTIVGKGLTNAYKIEASQEWSGAAIDPECFKISPNGKNFPFLLTHYMSWPLLMEYDIPIKVSKTIKGFAINWVDKNFNENLIISKFTKHQKQLSTEKEQAIVNNTIAFAKHAKHHGLKTLASQFFRILEKVFDVSIHSVDTSHLTKMSIVERSDTWISYLLKSKYYKLSTEQGISYITHTGTDRKIAYLQSQATAGALPINKPLIEALEGSFREFKKLDMNSRDSVIMQLIMPWY